MTRIVSHAPVTENNFQNEPMQVSKTEHSSESHARHSPVESMIMGNYISDWDVIWWEVVTCPLSLAPVWIVWCRDYQTTT